MWISRKHYKFLREKAENNIDAECQILTAKANKELEIARAVQEYSSVLKERDELRLRVAELEQQLTNARWQLVQMTQNVNTVNATNDTIPPACRSCSNHPSNGGSGICNCTLGQPVVTYRN